MLPNEQYPADIRYTLSGFTKAVLIGIAALYGLVFGAGMLSGSLKLAEAVFLGSFFSMPVLITLCLCGTKAHAAKHTKLKLCFDGISGTLRSSVTGQDRDFQIPFDQITDIHTTDQHELVFQTTSGALCIPYVHNAADFAEKAQAQLREYRHALVMQQTMQQQNQIAMQTQQPSNPSEEIAMRLNMLKHLHDSGIINADDYEIQKQKLLGQFSQL